MTLNKDSDPLDTLIIGAGFSGIAMGISLKHAGIGRFLILDEGSEPGGTWRDNEYRDFNPVFNHLQAVPRGVWAGLMGVSWRLCEVFRAFQGFAQNLAVDPGYQLDGCDPRLPRFAAASAKAGPGTHLEHRLCGGPRKSSKDGGV